METKDYYVAYCDGCCEPKNPTKFTNKEIIRLKMVLRELQGDLEGVSNIEFNDALKSIVK